MKQRDAALLASVEALQEASAAEKLLKCLRSVKPDSALRISVDYIGNETELNGRKPTVDSAFYSILISPLPPYQRQPYASGYSGWLVKYKKNFGKNISLRLFCPSYQT